MALVDISDIQEEIAKVLRYDTDLTAINAQITVEEEPQWQSLQPWVGIYWDRYDALPEQYAAGGQSMMYRLRFTIWCFINSLESYKAAIKPRNDLLAKVRLALMNNRTINDKAMQAFIEGGDIISANDPERGIIMGGEIVLNVDVEETS